MHLTDFPTLRDLPDSGWLQRLFDLNVRHVEQLGSFLAAPEGRYALERLGVPIEQVTQIITPVLQNQFGLSLGNPLQPGGEGSPSLLTRTRFPMGFYFGDNDPFREAAFDTALPPPPAAPGAGLAAVPPQTAATKITLQENAPFTASDQGKRGTCVAFSVAGMYQLMRRRVKVPPVQLSPQYLYYRTRADDNFPVDQDGTSFAAALLVLRKEGCCLEQALNYKPRHDLRQAYSVRGHNPARAETELRSLAKFHRITRHRVVPRTAAAVKAELAGGRPVGVGLAVYQLAWYNALARSRGEIAMPLVDPTGPQPRILDTYLGGHAVILVGYRDNSILEEESHRPGGGYFLFRNSWGEDWATGNDYAPGYGYLPYAYLERFCLEAAVIDELVTPPPVKAAGTKAATKPAPKGAKKAAGGPKKSPGTAKKS